MNNKERQMIQQMTKHSESFDDELYLRSILMMMTMILTFKYHRNKFLPSPSVNNTDLDLGFDNLLLWIR